MIRRPQHLMTALFEPAAKILPAALLALALCNAAPIGAESAYHSYKEGLSAEAREDYDAAYEAYQKAYNRAPKDLRFRSAYFRVRTTTSMTHLSKGRKLAAAGDTQSATAEFNRALSIDPSNEAAQQEIDHLRMRQGEKPIAESGLPETEAARDEIAAIGSPMALHPVTNEPLTLHMSEDAKTVYQAVGRAAGINVLFDPEYTGKRIQVDLNNVTLTDALRILGTLSNTFWRPVTDNTIFVAQNTRAKRTELETQAVQTFYLTNAWKDNDVTDVQTALRNVLGTNVKVYAVPSQDAIVMRGTPDELLLAQKLIDDLDKARPEVVVDIAILEVSKNWEKNLGLSWPSSASVALTTSSTSSSSSSSSSSTTTTTTPTVYDLANLKASNLAVTIGSATLEMLLSDSNTKILDNPRIRCLDQQKATMKIGKKIPIATGSYSSGTTVSTVSSLVNTQFQYQDVGVNIEMTPTIHFNHDVTLKVKIEDSSEAGTSTISGVTEPIIAQKTSEQVIRLSEGEASVMSGMMDKQDTVSWAGVPFLSAIPGLKYLFGNKDHTITEDEIVFVIIPHVVRTQNLMPNNLRTIDTGVGQAIELRHNAAPAQPNATPQQGRPAMPARMPGQPGGRPSARMNPAIAPLPGQSAEAAAPAALAQLRDGAAASATAAAQQAVTPQGSVAANAVISLAALPAPVPTGESFKLPIFLNGASDVSAAPLQLQYDAAHLALVNVDSGDLLNRDGQPVTLIHRDDGPGTILVNAARPPGAPGISGSGVVCILTFQAKAPGAGEISITHPALLNSAQQPVTVEAPAGHITVQVQ